jgi:hypothetical protein
MKGLSYRRFDVKAPLYRGTQEPRCNTGTWGTRRAGMKANATFKTKNWPLSFFRKL